MKLRSLLETKYGGQHHLSQHMDQIKLDHGPQQYRNLQTLLSQNKDKEVIDWLKGNLYVEDLNDIGPIDKAINEKIKSFIKKEIDECWKTYKQVGMKKKGNKMVPNCVPKNENLRNWFKKEKWKRIDTQGNIAGDCGTMPKGKKTQRCLPQAKAQSLTKKQRAATSRKKTASNKQFVKNTKAAKVKK